MGRDSNFIYKMGGKVKKEALNLVQLPFLIPRTVLQEAEVALNARIKDPIFHRVRDVAPNKVHANLRTGILKLRVRLIAKLGKWLKKQLMFYEKVGN